jgi:hypothetical protein
MKKSKREKEEDNKENVKELIQELIIFDRNLLRGPDQRELASLIRKLVNNVLDLKQVLRFIQMKIDTTKEPTVKIATTRKQQLAIWEEVKRIFKEHIQNIEK